MKYKFIFLVLVKPPKSPAPVTPNFGGTWGTLNYLPPPELGVGGQNHTCNQQRRFFCHIKIKVNGHNLGEWLVNAAEMATNLEFASKIATVVNLFKLEFPDAKSDLKPWCNDPETLDLVDPDSIDIGFHFPGVSKSWRSRSVLIQIRFYQDPLNESPRRAIGVEVAGFNHLGEQWRLSTIDDWRFVGKTEPSVEIGDKLKEFCRQVLQVFNQKSEEI